MIFGRERIIKSVGLQGRSIFCEENESSTWASDGLAVSRFGECFFLGVFMSSRCRRMRSSSTNLGQSQNSDVFANETTIQGVRTRTKRTFFTNRASVHLSIDALDKATDNRNYFRSSVKMS